MSGPETQAPRTTTSGLDAAARGVGEEEPLHQLLTPFTRPQPCVHGGRRALSAASELNRAPTTDQFSAAVDMRIGWPPYVTNSRSYWSPRGPPIGRHQHSTRW
jgi:hypothetical protein